MNSTHHLTPEFVAVRDLDPPARARMFVLLSGNYDHVGQSRFDADLDEKDEVLLLRDGAGQVQGFSTLKYWDETFEGEPLRILFPAIRSSTALIGARSRWPFPGSSGPGG